MVALSLRKDVLLAEYSTLKVGGLARYLVEVTSVADLRQAVQFARARQLPYIVLGGGSNVFFADGGYAGLVIVVRISGREYVMQADGTVLATFGAGEIFDAVVAETVGKEWWGLENLSHIPGTVGATPVQNVGAYGVEVADIITAVEVFDTATETVTMLSPAQCQFGYRDSIFKTDSGASLVVTRVQFRLLTTPQPHLSYADLAGLVAQAQKLRPIDVRTAVVAIRAQKFPDWTTVGTAGSFFKNPIITTASAVRLTQRYPDMPLHAVSAKEMKVSLGYVLDKICQRKGYRKGNVGLSEAQALVLIAYEGATAEEVLHFSNAIAAEVLAATGIKIFREVTYVSCLM